MEILQIRSAYFYNFPSCFFDLLFSLRFLMEARNVAVTDMGHEIRISEYAVRVTQAASHCMHRQVVLGRICSYCSVRRLLQNDRQQ